MSGERANISDMLRAGTCAAINLGMGFTIFVPTQRPQYAQERGPGRLGTMPSKPKPKPVHGGYPEADSHKLAPGEFGDSPLSRAVKATRPSFSIVKDSR